MAQTWWEPENNPLISMNPVRMSFILQRLQQTHSISLDHKKKSIGETTRPTFQPLKGLKALDVGCGGGLLSESLARLGANVTAVDPSVHVANAAREHSNMDEVTRDIDYRGGTSVEDLAEEYVDKQEEGDLFDIVCILEVIEHATDPLSLVRNAASLLKKPSNGRPGGVLFISTVNRTAKSFAVAIVGGEYVLGKLPIGTHSWEKFLSPKEVCSMVDKCGLKEHSINGMVLRPPFYDMSWYLDESDVDINWIGAYSYR